MEKLLEEGGASMEVVDGDERKDNGGGGGGGRGRKESVSGVGMCWCPSIRAAGECLSGAKSGVDKSRGR